MSTGEIIQPKFQVYDFEYWLMHVTALLRCIQHHKGYSNDFSQVIKQNRQGWSLESFKGNTNISAFPQAKASIQNWGVQYLFAHIFNTNKLGLLDILLEAIGNESKFPNLDNIEYVECFVAGADSQISSKFLEDCNARILGDLRRRVHTSLNYVQFTDLCLLIKLKNRETFAIFGEVEGNHGEYLRSVRHWQGKSDYALFGIGFLSHLTNEISIEVLNVNNKPKIIFLFGTQQNVIADFHNVVDLVEKSIHHGPNDKWWTNLQSGLKEAIGIVIQNWRTPVIQLIEQLEQHLTFEQFEVKTLNYFAPEIVTMPKILAI